MYKFLLTRNINTSVNNKFWDCARGLLKIHYLEKCLQIFKIQRKIWDFGISKLFPSLPLGDILLRNNKHAFLRATNRVYLQFVLGDIILYTFKPPFLLYMKLDPYRERPLC